MAALKTKENDGDVHAFLSGIEPEQKKADSFALLEFLQEISGEPARMWGSNIIGFGHYQYKYASGREGEWFQVGFSPRKQNFSLYIMNGFDDYAQQLERLGKHKTGKSCLYVKRLSDIDMEVLKDMVEQSIQSLKEKYPAT